MRNIKLIYDNNATWEKDYILELFSNVNCDIIYIESGKLNYELEKEHNIINNNIFVFSSNSYTYKEILNVVLRIRPKIIVHLSDEYGDRGEYTHLASHTKLLLHQHHFNHYPYNNYNNIIQIPLGYMTGMFDGKKALDYKTKPLLDRKYKWSFIGAIKQDRQKLINNFSKKFKENFVGNNMLPSEMRNIYNNSIFVPNGKGNVVIDCFRIYEAILSGSIPIIVCDKSEFNERFYFNNDIPPFIYEKKWSKASTKCKQLLNNEEKLKKVAKKNYRWLK